MAWLHIAIFVYVGTNRVALEVRSVIWISTVINPTWYKLFLGYQEVIEARVTFVHIRIGSIEERSNVC